jgi:hypothetical protein
MITVHMVNKVKFTGFTKFEGLTKVKTKKEMQLLVNAMYDAVKENPEIVCNFSLNNTGDK